jgi:hypothetical protein
VCARRQEKLSLNFQSALQYKRKGSFQSDLAWLTEPCFRVFLLGGCAVWSPAQTCDCHNILLSWRMFLVAIKNPVSFVVREIDSFLGDFLSNMPIDLLLFLSTMHYGPGYLPPTLFFFFPFFLRPQFRVYIIFSLFI